MMKNEYEIRKKLNHVVNRHAVKYVKSKISRHFYNCKYNIIVEPEKAHGTDAEDVIDDLYPNKSVTRLNLYPGEPTGACTYGNNGQWNGVICDNDEIPSGCPKFTNTMDKETALSEFNSILKDDDLVLKQYKDIAILQWVLDDRMREVSLSLFSRISIIITYLLLLIPRKINKDIFS